MKFVNSRVCPLRALPRFADHTDAEAASIEAMKRSGLTRAEQSILHKGQSAAPTSTLLSGWTYRLNTLSGGRRQILNFLWQGTSSGCSRRWATHQRMG